MYTTRYAGGRSPALAGIDQRNGRPYKPTTQGKIERLWQTLKKRLAARAPETRVELQAELDEFRTHDNDHRPHRSLGSRTPAFAYTLIPKATPTKPESPELWRVRYDTIDHSGKVSLRLGNKMTHLGYGRTHARTNVIILIHRLDATTITHSSEVIAEHHLDPTKSYQPKTRKRSNPQNAGSTAHDVLRHHMVRRSEVFANLTKPVQALLGAVERGELSELLARAPRPVRPVGSANRRLSPAEIDQLVADYRIGVGSIYDLADLYGVHRNTIAQHLKKRGVQLGMLPLQDFEADRARELHAQGLSLNAIGRALRRDPKTVKTAVT